MTGRAEQAPSSKGSLRLDLWVGLLVAVLCAPMLVHGGYGLARDLVFVPEARLGLDQIGLGSSLPRAVPLDAVIGLFGWVDGAIVFRVAVLGTLLLAGCGAHRLMRDAPLTSRLLLATAAIWNPYVVERLALGQWALLTSYAAIWWMVPVVRLAVTTGGRRRWCQLVLLVGLSSLTPTGGLIALLVVTCVALATVRNTRAVLAAATALVFQLPWVLPSVLGRASGLSDPRGVAAFAARAERPGGPIPSLLAGGGIWDPHVVPTSLTGPLGQLLVLLSLGALVVGLGGVRRRFPGLAPAAAVGFGLVLAGVVPGVDGVLAQVAAHVPGGGLLRDGQKWLAPYVILVVACGAEALSRLERRMRRLDLDLATLTTGVLAVVPVLLVLDAPLQTWEALTPVRYPADLRAAIRALERADPGTGDIATLPWASYRQFAWGRPTSASDPAVPWSRRPVVASDRLRVDGVTLAGEDPRAREVGRIVTDGRPVGPRLAAAGVGWVLVYRDQPGARDLPLSGLRAVLEGHHVALYAVPGAIAGAPVAGAFARVLVIGVDGLLLGWVLGSALLVLPRNRSRTGPPTPGPAA